MKIVYTIRPLFLAILLNVFTLSMEAGEGGGPLVTGLLLGGSENEHITGSARMTNGDVVVCGWTESYDIPVTVPSLKATNSGGKDAFVAVLSSDLTVVKAFTFYGGAQDDKAVCVGVDGTGQIIVIGETESPDLAMSTGSISQVYSANIDGFIAVFNSALTVLQRSTYINGIGDDHPMAMAVDPNGGIFFCGYTNSRSGFPTNNGYDRSYNGAIDGFVCKVDVSLSSMQFSTYFGGENDDLFHAIHLLSDGSVAVTGSTSSSSYETFPKVQQWQWPPTNDRPYDATYNGGTSDAVLTIFTQDGAQLVSSTYYGGGAADVGKAVFSDSRGRVVVVGESSSIDLPIVGGLQTAPRGGSDVMIALFNAKARTLAGSTFYGGSGNEHVSRALPETDDVWLIVGTTASDDLPAIGAGSTTQRKGATDGFAAKIGLASLFFSTTIGWSHDDEIHSLLIDDTGDLYLSGNSNSPVIMLDQTELSGVAKNDAFTVKWAFGSVGITAPRGGERLCVGQSINVNWNTIDMGPLEPFSIERSADGATWIPIVANVTGRAYTWRPTASEVDPKGVFVRATTTRGHVSTTTDRVVVDPRVTIEPLQSSLTACDAGRVVVETRTTGMDLRYTWRRNGVALIQQGSSLVLDPVDATSAGRYECYVTGGCGQTVGSSTMSVSVVTLPTFTLNPTSQAVNEGTSVEFRAASEPTGDYGWYKVGQELPITTGPILRFSSARAQDAGRYWCRVVTSCGMVDSDTATFLVNPVSVAASSPESIDFSLHPNPTCNNIQIRSGQAIISVMVVNLTGEVALELPRLQTNIGVLDVDLAEVPIGPYCVMVRDATGFLHTRHILIVR